MIRTWMQSKDSKELHTPALPGPISRIPYAASSLALRERLRVPETVRVRVLVRVLVRVRVAVRERVAVAVAVLERVAGREGDSGTTRRTALCP